MSDLMRPDLRDGYIRAMLALQATSDKLNQMPLENLLALAQEPHPEMDPDGEVPRFLQAAITFRDAAKAYGEFQQRFLAERLQRKSS